MTTDTATPDLLADARAAFGRHDWGQAYDLFSQVDSTDGLSPADLETFAGVAWFAGRGIESLALTEKAFHAHFAVGDKVRAAYVAFQLATQFGLRNKNSIAAAWLLRTGVVPRSAAAYCLGWVLVIGFAVAGRPEGDFAVAGDLAGYTLMGTGLVLVVLGVASLAAPGKIDPVP